MKQQPQIVSRLTEFFYKLQKQLFPQSSMGNHSSSMKDQFVQFIKQIQSYLAQTENERLKYVQELSQSNRKIKIYQASMQQMNQQLERLRMLLPIKEQLISSCKKEISVLQNTIKQSLQTSTSNKDKSVDEFAVSRVFEEVQLSFNEKQHGFNRNNCIGLAQTKPKILFKKSADESYRKDLDMAKLKNQLCKLNLQNKNLKGQLDLLKIENEHLFAQIQALKEEQHFMYNFVSKISTKTLNNDLKTKCQKLESYIDKLTSKLQKMEINEHTYNSNHRVDLPLHPPTPHFSGGNLGLGHKQRSFDFPEVLELNQSLISMGESISEGLQ